MNFTPKVDWRPLFLRYTQPVFMCNSTLLLGMRHANHNFGLAVGSPDPLGRPRPAGRSFNEIRIAARGPRGRGVRPTRDVTSLPGHRVCSDQISKCSVESRSPTESRSAMVRGRSSCGQELRQPGNSSSERSFGTEHPGVRINFFPLLAASVDCRLKSSGVSLR